MRNIEDLCPRSSYEEKACIISLLTQLVPTVEPELLLSQNDAPPLLILKHSRFLQPVQVLAPLGS